MSLKSSKEHELQAKQAQFYDQYQHLKHSTSAPEALKACEKALSTYLGSVHALLFCSEAACLQMLLEAFKLLKFDRVYVSEYVSASLHTVIKNTPAQQYVVSAHPVSRQMDLEALAPLLRRRTTRGRDVIIVSHAAGSVFDVDALEQLIEDPNTIIIEDATESFGALDRAGKRVGSSHLSDATVFGFSKGSLIDVDGAGAIATSSQKLEKALRSLQQDGRFLPSLAQTLLLQEALKV